MDGIMRRFHLIRRYQWMADLKIARKNLALRWGFYRCRWASSYRGYTLG